MGTKKKVIHIVMITEDNVYPTKEISLSESPLQMVMHFKSFQISFHSFERKLEIFVKPSKCLLTYDHSV